MRFDWHPIFWILAFPLLGVLINGFFGKWTRRFGWWVPGAIASALVILSFGVAYFVMLPAVDAVRSGAGFKDFILYSWLTQDPSLMSRGPALNIPFGVRADPLSLMMVLVVTGVGSLIHLYAIAYMQEDERIPRFFTYLNLFTFAMLLLVMANNYLLMFVGWEGVGVSSFLLIGFWFEKPIAARAGMKAMLVNRVGDFGFILGMIFLFSITGTLTFSTPDGSGVFDKIAAGTDPRLVPGGLALTIIAVLLLLGATGKSAQLPLYLWLPDAMEGPTPVSALMHAATMVTAGVYLIARSSAIFSRVPNVEYVVALVGAGTALFAAIIAIYQYDIKRVLAFSTVSQIGYMFLGVGVGAYATGLSHLVTHAFFKGLLFLCAGSVMHAMAGELDMRKMGGLSKVMKFTTWTFFCGWLAISGIPPFAGFYSKDAILHAAMGRWPVFSWIGLFAAGLTAFYMTRLWLTTFWGSPRWQEAGDHAGADCAHDQDDAGHGHAHAHPGRSDVEAPAAHHAHGHAGHDHGGHGHGGHGHHPHESPPLMWIPLVVLAVLSVIGGRWVAGTWGLTDDMWLGEQLRPSFKWAQQAAGEAAHHGPFTGFQMAAMSVTLALLGIGGAFFLHIQHVFARGWRESNWWVRLVDARFGYDWLLWAVFVKGGEVVSMLLYAFVDVLIIDGIVNGVGRLTTWVAGNLRQLQTGFVRSYALVLLMGAVWVVLALAVNWR